MRLKTSSRNSPQRKPDHAGYILEISPTLKAPDTVTTLNIDGLKSNLIYTQELLEKCNILCFQEHWLHTYGPLKPLKPKLTRAAVLSVKT